MILADTGGLLAALALTERHGVASILTLDARHVRTLASPPIQAPAIPPVVETRT